MQLKIPEIQIVDDNKTILSNFKLLSQNWENLKEYLRYLSENFNDLISEDVIQSILDKIILNINQYKFIISINKDQIIGDVVQFNTANTNFSVKRIDATSFQISKTNDTGSNQWNTIPLIINVHRTDTRDVIYPIITKNVGNGSAPPGAGAFKITFSNPVEFNFTCVFI
jgi:hypothetical protein